LSAAATSALPPISKIFAIDSLSSIHLNWTHFCHPERSRGTSHRESEFHNSSSRLELAA
jgi:hypothetical protein